MNFNTNTEKTVEFINKNKLILFTVFLAYCTYGYLNHNYFRDEVHSWLIASNSDSITNLWQNKRFEGHPIGWYLILFFTHKIRLGFNGAVFIHYFVSFAIAYLLIFKISLPIYLKIFLVFGSFLGHEYLFYIRNYNIPILLILIYFLVSSKYKKAYFGKIILLSLAIQFNIYATILVGSLFAELLFRIYDGYAELSKKEKAEILIAIFIFLLSITFFYYSTVPPANSGLKNVFKIGTSLKYFVNFISTISLLGDISPFFGINIFLKNLGIRLPFIHVISAFIILYLFIWSYKAQKSLFVFCVSFFFGIFLLSCVTNYFTLSIRHTGIFLIFMVCIILLTTYENNSIFLQNPFFKAFIIFTFFLQFIFGIKQYLKGNSMPESNSQEAANYILNNYENPLIAGYEDFTTSTVSYYLKKPIYNFSKNKFQNFPIWDRNSDMFLQNTPISIRLKCLELQKKYFPQNLILLYSVERDTTGLNLIPKAIFNKPTVDDRTENMYLFEF